MYQDVLNLVGLLNLYANTSTVDTRLDQDSLILIPGHYQRVQEDFRRARCFYFWHIVTFRGLGCEVGERQRGGEGCADTLQVGTEGLRLRSVS